MAFFLCSLPVLGLVLNAMIPDKPPAIVEAVLSIPDTIKESIHSIKTGPPPSIESYKQHAAQIKKKYRLEK